MILRPNVVRSWRRAGLLQRGLRQPDGDRGDAEPPGIQCAESDLETLTLVADTPVGVHARIVVVRGGGGHRVQPHLLLGLAEAQAGDISGDRKQEMPREPSPVRANSV